MTSSASLSGGNPLHDINVYAENPTQRMARVVLEPLATDWETIPDRTNILNFIRTKFAEHGMDPQSILKVDGHVQRDGDAEKYDDEGERNSDWARQAPVLDCYRHKGKDCLKGTIEWTVTVEEEDGNETSYTFKQVLYTLEEYSNDRDTQDRAKERALIGLNCAVKAMKSGVYALSGNYVKAGLTETDNCEARVNQITNSHIFRVSAEHPRDNAAPTIHLLENAESAPTSITLKPLSQYKWTVIEGNKGYYTRLKDDDSENSDSSESSGSSGNETLSFYDVIIRSARNTIVRQSQNNEEDDDDVSESGSSKESLEIDESEEFNEEAFNETVRQHIQFLEQTSRSLEAGETVDQDATYDEITRICNYYNNIDGWIRAGTVLGEAYDRCLNAYEHRFPG